MEGSRFKSGCSGSTHAWDDRSPGVRWSKHKNTLVRQVPQVRSTEDLSQPDKGIFMRFGGDGEDRTPDLCNANATLSQLSYAPMQEKV